MVSYVIWAAGAGLVASAGLVAAVRAWARRANLLDHPNDRSLHVRPTPRGGGIGIAIPVCAALWAVAALDPEARMAAASLGGIGLFVAVVGLSDDVRGLSAPARLVAQVLAALLLSAAVGTWSTVRWPGLFGLEMGLVALPFTLLVVVGLTNAYNFMDGIDGIAGAQGVIAGLGWLEVGLLLQDPLVAVTGAVIAAACAGFLLFNWSPASIFMGDVGSSFLGFTLAALAVFVSFRLPAAATAGLLFVWPYVFDTAFTMLRRAARREHLLSAHRSHLYQRLVLTGLSHRAVAVLYAGLASVGVAVGIAFLRGVAFASIGGAAVIVALAAALWAGVVWRERTAGTCHAPVHISHGA